MRYVGLVAVIALTAACGSDPIAAPSSTTPATPAPIPAANLVATGALSFPQCPQLVLAPLIGQPIASCPIFTGVVQNLGPGCASNVHGVVTISNGGGSAGWRYGAIVRPSEQIAYSGGPITVPALVSWFYTAAPVWDNVRCP